MPPMRLSEKTQLVSRTFHVRSSALTFSHVKKRNHVGISVDKNVQSSYDYDKERVLHTRYHVRPVVPMSSKLRVEAP